MSMPQCRTLLKYARKLMCGAACLKHQGENGEIRYQAVCRTSKCTNTCASHLAGMSCWSRDCGGISRSHDPPNCRVFGLHACLARLVSSITIPANMTAVSTEMRTHGYNSFRTTFWSSCCVSKTVQCWFRFLTTDPCGFSQTCDSHSSSSTCPPFVSNILQSASLHLNMLLAQRFQQQKREGRQIWKSLLSDVHVCAKMARHAGPPSRANSSFRFMFALRKGVHMQSFQITESWQLQTNALVAGMCSVAGALRNNTLGELCAISNSLAVVVLWCSSQKFPVITFAHIARLHLQRCHNCGTTWSNMLLGPGAKSSCSEPHSLQPVCFTIDAWELGPPAARPMAKRVLWGPKRTWQRPCISSPGCASRTLEVRELPAACFVTFILPKACPYVQAVLDATKQYADKAKSAQSGKCEAPPGEPHVHAWAALLRVALDDAALNAEDRQAIEQHRAVSTDALVMSGIVYVCKTAKPLTGTA